MIEILLATYQGEKYLAQQLDSILSQSFTEWSLLIHDDGSTDGTTDIIKRYVRRHPKRISLIEDGVKTGSAKGNFSYLMQRSSAEHIMFCDQDDVWLDDKLVQSRGAMMEAEAKFGERTPLATFADYSVVDGDLNPIATSGWRLQRNGPQFSKDIRLLAVRNCITGCTLMINRAALRASLPIPDEAVMHDWWIGLSTLRHNGRLIAIHKPLVLYRQHGGNVVGSKSFDPDYFRHRAMQWKTLVDGLAVYRMAKRIGAVKNPFEFLRCKHAALRLALGQVCDRQ